MTRVCFILLWCHIVKAVISEVSLIPPRDIHVDNWMLTWTPTTEDEDTTYDVEYRSFDSDQWKVVPACAQTPSNSCNIGPIATEADYGCTALRVRAERDGRTSRQVAACSRHADSCSPGVNLTTRPGFLTVHLSRDNSLSLENGDHVKQRVYFGREGEPLEPFRNVGSSMSIHDLQEGQRYCISVEYIFFSKPVGLPSCTQCEIIPESSTVMSQVGIIIAVTIALVLVFFVAYVFIFQLGRIKKWLQPPCRIPDHFLPLDSSPESPIHNFLNISEEHFDTFSIMTLEK